MAESFALEGLPLLLAQIAYGYGQLGLDKDAERVLRFFRQAAVDGSRIAEIGWAIASLARRNEERTLQWLQRVADNQPYEGYNIIMKIKANVGRDPILSSSDLTQVRQTLGTI